MQTHDKRALLNAGRLIGEAVAKTEEVTTNYETSLQCAKSNRFPALQYLLEARVGCVEDGGAWLFKPDAYLMSELNRCVEG